MRVFIPGVLIIVDVVAAAACLAAAVALRNSLVSIALGLGPFAPVTSYVTLWPALFLLLVIRAAVGLYPGYGRTDAEELRAQSLATVAVAAFLLVGSAFFRFSEVYSRAVLLMTFLLLWALLPVTRATVKALLVRLPGYGIPVVVLGRGQRFEALVALLKDNPGLGLRPQEPNDPGRMRSRHCILVPEGFEAPLVELLDELNHRFRRVWLVPDLLDVSSVWVSARDLRGHLALEVRNNIVEPRNRFAKRVLDVTAVLVTLPIALPLMALVAAWVLLDSRGPVLFWQTRVGQYGRPFSVLKFRTMHRNANAMLEKLLQTSPEAKAEWDEWRKLRNDPRVTRVGRLLRRTSLDELPQLFNVLHGEMSLVGPRPVMKDELANYGDRVHLYDRLKPGLTGLVQVSGRSTLTYKERVRLDAYYARNWSLWLDLVILARTAAAVLFRTGAY